MAAPSYTVGRERIATQASVDPTGESTPENEADPRRAQPSREDVFSQARTEESKAVTGPTEPPASPPAGE